MKREKGYGTNLAVRRLSLAAATLAIAATGQAPAADMLNGGRLYAAHCASCHGQSGVGVMPNAPNFVRGDDLMRPDNALLSAIRSGKAAMPAYAGILSDREILDVIAYLRTLR